MPQIPASSQTTGGVRNRWCQSSEPHSSPKKAGQRCLQLHSYRANMSSFLLHPTVVLDRSSDQSRCKVYLRECKCHQGSTDNNEVQNVPQVPEVGPRVQQQAQVYHLKGISRHQSMQYIRKREAEAGLSHRGTWF